VNADREQTRRRVLAFTGVWLLLAGLLTALSLVVVVLIASTLMLVVGLAAGGLRRYPIRKLSRAAAGSATRTGRALGARLRKVGVRRHLRPARERARNVGTNAPRRGRALLLRAGQAYAVAVRSVHVRTVRLHRPVLPVPTLTRTTPGLERQALHLNELGAQLRREGESEQAAEQHRVALAIVRDLGDQHAEALTLNNLGLALAQGGAEESAVQHLEQAVTVLRELGDEEHEGQVIANLGFVHRRQGHSETAVTLLHEALDKLPPESPAYRKVEEHLSRAS
jgi:tetratricopeptide (TPR) repeat protein